VLHKHLPVRQAGQGVVIGFMEQFFFNFFPLFDLQA